MMLVISFINGFDMDAYRLIQYDKGSQQYGSRLTGVNSPISIANFGSSSISARNIIVLNIEQLLTNNTKNAKLQTIINREDVSGLLIVLPRDGLNFEIIEQFKSIEKQLLVSKFEKPIYFIFKNDKTSQMIRDIENGSDSILDESYQAVITEQEAKPIEQIPVVNIHSLLNGKSNEKSQTIGIVAHYDTISSIPGLSASGSFGDSTGVIGLLEIARLFQKINSAQSTKLSHNLLFILTGASRLGFTGTKHWLKNADQRLINQLDFVLCLDSLVSMTEKNKLFIHISEKSTDKNVINLFKQFLKTAKQMQIDLQFIEKKVEREIVWEHEIFSKKGISSASISSQSAPSPSLLTKTNSLDQLPLDIEQLKRNVRLITESIANHLSENIKIDNLDYDEKFIRSFLKIMTKSSRFTPTLNKDNEIVKNLKVTLQQYTSQAQVQDFIIGNSPYKFFTNTIVKLSIHKVSPISLDLILISCVLTYLLALHIYLVGTKSFTSNLLSLFEKQERKKK
ncbi:predicted protein [Naegleria gruberi]|uniref:BOS complex subunit NCLN n=1 Tax=Naegleria gruberi TaxID=5762 RepID=D2VEN7_NAEGR|nr:uncharacterized protein NAEGRDRAFT_48930 [Naegleria gruberi]EFC44534.1 predicted protein [Naegleria gruberi]|eukprot:XP_002677278.1 predicted protein [Naegleria gruberi strain NEG-M]